MEALKFRRSILAPSAYGNEGIVRWRTIPSALVCSRVMFISNIPEHRGLDGRIAIKTTGRTTYEGTMRTQW